MKIVKMVSSEDCGTLLKVKLKVEKEKNPVKKSWKKAQMIHTAIKYERQFLISTFFVCRLLYSKNARSN